MFNMKLSLLCCLPATLALPFASHQSRFSIKQVEVQGPKRSFFDHHSKAVRKYHAKVPEHIAVKLESAQADYTVVASPEEGDSFYLSPVTIGDQTFNLDFDTGSSDLWVFSSQAAQGQTVYDADSGKLLNGETWSITYGDGSGASGIVYQDTATIGGLSVSDQAIEVATNAEGNVDSQGQDGLVGLAFSGLNTVQPNQQKTFFDNAVAQGLKQQLFAAALKAGQPGSYDFGSLDSSKYTGDIKYIQVSEAGFWQISDPVLGDTIFDTGTTLLFLPSSVTEAYYSQIPSASNEQGMWVFDCSEQLPDFTFNLGDVETGVSGQLMNFGPVDSSNCAGGLQESDSLGMPVNILGDVYLKEKYIVFDLNGGSPQVGITSAA